MKNFFKKLTIGATVTAMSAALLTGCGNNAEGSSPSTETSTPKTAEETVGTEGTDYSGITLHVTMALSEEEWAVMRKDVLPGFEAQTGCTVDAAQIEASDVAKQLQAMHNAGNMQIDVIAQDVGNMNSLVYDGLVEDLSEYTNLIPAEALGSLADAGQFDGKTYFMPYRPNAEIDYYNTDKFTEYGLSTPTTWDELYDTAKALKEKEGLGRLCLKLKLEGDAIELVEFIRGAGGDPLVLNDEGSIEAFTFLQKLWPELSEDTLTASFSSTNTYLATDEVYYAPNWPFAANIIVKDGGKQNLSAYAGYSGPKGYIKTLGGEMLGIPVGSPNKELALEFIQYLESKEVQTTLMRENGWISFRNDVYEEVEEWQRPFMDATMEALAAAQPLPHVSYWSDAQQCINDAAKEICLDQKDVKEVLDKYAAKLEDLKANAD